MAQCVVIADDLTGANATGVLLKQLNYNAQTILNKDFGEESNALDFDCIIYPTDSRSISSDDAYQRVYQALELFKSDEVKVFSHRIDSTMRGNLGSETDAMLDLLGEDYVAIVAPCFPTSGRTVCGGYLLVNGVPVHKTDIALDPKTPVKESQIANLFAQQSKYPVANLYLADLMNGKHKLAEKMNHLVAQGNRILVLDCITQEDLDLIADAVITSKLKVLAVDPGVFTATLARKSITPHERKEKNHILTVVGSVHPMTSTQFKELLLSQRVNAIEVQTAKLLQSEESRQREIDRVVQAVLANYDKFYVSAISGDGLNFDKRINFAPFQEKYHCSLDEVTQMINTSFGEITYRILKAAPSFKGLYTSGGDITVAVCQRLAASGIELKGEVLPLAAYGKLSGGEFNGVHLVTKGGSQGSKDAIKECVEYLKNILYI